MPPAPPLKHLAVIMDGNGRWAKSRKHSRLFGHVRGAKTSHWLIQHCSQLKIPFLSLFALSTENIKRPSVEVKSLKNLLEKIFLKRSHILMKEQIKLHILGDLSIFSPSLQILCRKLCQQTKDHQGLSLIVALNYGGRQEILQGVKKMAQKIEQGQMRADELDESALASFFCSSCFPPPDLIIRTGGQVRFSNFYLWSSAYSELYFTDTLWPDFNQRCLDQALEKFHKTKRKFGKI